MIAPQQIDNRKPSFPQVSPVAYRRREFVPFNVLMLIRAVAGSERSNQRRIVFTEKGKL